MSGIAERLLVLRRLTAAFVLTVFLWYSCCWEGCFRDATADQPLYGSGRDVERSLALEDATDVGRRRWSTSHGPMHRQGLGMHLQQGRVVCAISVSRRLSSMRSSWIRLGKKPSSKAVPAMIFIPAAQKSMAQHHTRTYLLVLPERRVASTRFGKQGAGRSSCAVACGEDIVSQARAKMVLIDYPLTSAASAASLAQIHRMNQQENGKDMFNPPLAAC